MTQILQKSRGLINLNKRMRAGLSEFIHLEVSGSIVLLIATILALILANSPWAEQYFALWETKIGLKFGSFEFFETSLHWINDFLMAFFFFVVGLEIKREFIAGELSSIRKAIIPIMAAIGGMAIPALIYVAFNWGGEAIDGWGVPMATDIAFALGVLALLGSRVPTSLKVFLTALAIVDDIGAILVIATFYTERILWTWLGIAFVMLIAMFLYSLVGGRSRFWTVLVAIIVWFAFFESGVHATIAGVLVAFTIPARARREPMEFVTWGRRQLQEIETYDVPGAHVLESNDQQVIARTLQKAAREIQSPLQIMEHALHPFTTFFVLPLFAFANAGVPLGGNPITQVANPVGLGIIFGLVLGKQLGVTLFSFIAVKLSLGNLPEGITWKQVYGVSWLAGIGFTVALFISNLAFDPALIPTAKVAVLISSVIAGGVGYVILRFVLPPAPAEVESKAGSRH